MTKAWTDWETTRRRVTIAVRVLDAEGWPAAGPHIAVTATPGEVPFLAKADGIHYVLDLPPGTYTVKGTDERSGAQCEETVSVSRSRDGVVEMAVAELRFPRVVRG